MKIVAFDFDGTLTTKDTLIEFIRDTRGVFMLLLGFLLFSPLLVLMKCRLYPNWKAKQHLFSFFFRGCTLDEFNGYCDNFASDRKELLRPKGLQLIKDAIKEGAEVLVVSASIDNWVAPFFKGLDVNVVGTKIEVRDGRITGRFCTNNCYGQEKVNRIKKLYPLRSQYTLVAYGDSRGDREMLEYADESHYTPFR